MTQDSSLDTVLFTGTHPCRLDSKGRMSVLKPFLDVYLERNNVHRPVLFLSAGERHGVLAVNMFDPLYRDANKDKDNEQLYRCFIDEQKRIVVPKPLIDYADLRSDVVISATDEGDHLCLYNALAIEKAEILVRKAAAEQVRKVA